MQVRCPVTRKLMDLWHPIRMAKTFNSHKWVQMNRRRAGTETHAQSHSLQRHRASEVWRRSETDSERGEGRWDRKWTPSKRSQNGCAAAIRGRIFFLISTSTLAFLCTPCALVGINEMFAERKEKKNKQSETGMKSVRRWRPKDCFFFLQVDRINEWRGWSDVVVSQCCAVAHKPQWWRNKWTTLT